MKLTPELLAFAILAGGAATSAVGVVAFRNAVRSALCLVVTFIFLAFLYFGLGAEMIGVTQIIVYTGAIMVLFLFVLMLLNLGDQRLTGERSDPKFALGILTGVALLALVGSQLIPALLNRGEATAGANWGKPEVLGRALFTDAVFPFEAVSFLLLIGVVGSILLAKRKL